MTTVDWLLDSDPGATTAGGSTPRNRSSRRLPAWWHYDVLRALDYFRAVGDEPDTRVAEAIAVLRSKQQTDGTWLLEGTHSGAVHFTMEDGDGRPSRWTTLRALRVLNWHDGNVDRAVTSG